MSFFTSIMSFWLLKPTLLYLREQQDEILGPLSSESVSIALHYFEKQMSLYLFTVKPKSLLKCTCNYKPRVPLALTQNTNCHVKVYIVFSIPECSTYCSRIIFENPFSIFSIHCSKTTFLMGVLLIQKLRGSILQIENTNYRILVFRRALLSLLLVYRPSC